MYSPKERLNIATKVYCQYCNNLTTIVKDNTFGYYRRLSAWLLVTCVIESIIILAIYFK